MHYVSVKAAKIAAFLSQMGGAAQCYTEARMENENGFQTSWSQYDLTLQQFSIIFYISNLLQICLLNVPQW